METNYKQKVFRMAYELVNATGKTFSVCLARAWALHRLTERMRLGTVTFAYERADGSLRKARGTLKNVQGMIKGTGKETFKTVKYYDVEAKGFRSFRVENFITIYK